MCGDSVTLDGSPLQHVTISMVKEVLWRLNKNKFSWLVLVHMQARAGLPTHAATVRDSQNRGREGRGETSSGGERVCAGNMMHLLVRIALESKDTTGCGFKAGVMWRGTM